MSEFRKIKSLKFLYEVNKDGVIRNVKSKKIVKGYVEKNGYVRVRFENKCLGGIVRTTVHRVVAEAFIPNPNNLEEVNHIDSNRTNNCVENLEWVSHSENMIHACTVGKKANQIQKTLVENRESLKKKVSNGEQVFDCISNAGRWLAENNRCKDYKSGIAGISSVCRKKRHTFGGYSWFYV